MRVSMCTLIVLHRCVPGSPLVVAANRDEFLDRPAEELALRSSRTGPIVAPLDLEAGGTWVGVSERGVFAGLTNLRPPAGVASQTDALAAVMSAAALRKEAVRSELRSRGEVVMRALEAESAPAAMRTLTNLEREAYNPFQLLVADGRDAWLVVYRGQARAVKLEPGLHIVGNIVGEEVEMELGSARAPRTAEEEPRVRKLTRIRERVEKWMTEPGRDSFEGLARICREHIGNEIDPGREALSPFESTCVHVANRYGTRSSLLLELSEDPSANRLWTTDGPPCERSYENRSSLLRELGVTLSDRVETETT